MTLTCFVGEESERELGQHSQPTMLFLLSRIILFVEGVLTGTGVQKITDILCKQRSLFMKNADFSSFLCNITIVKREVLNNYLLWGIRQDYCRSISGLRSRAILRWLRSYFFSWLRSRLRLQTQSRLRLQLTSYMHGSAGVASDQQQCFKKFYIHST